MSEAQQEKPANAWGQPISKERWAELAAMSEAWDAPGADHSERTGPFDDVALCGADAFWLAMQSWSVAALGKPNLHLETLYVNTL